MTFREDEGYMWQRAGLAFEVVNNSLKRNAQSEARALLHDFCVKVSSGVSATLENLSIENNCMKLHINVIASKTIGQTAIDQALLGALVEGRSEVSGTPSQVDPLNKTNYTLVCDSRRSASILKHKISTSKLESFLHRISGYLVSLKKVDIMLVKTQRQSLDLQKCGSIVQILFLRCFCMQRLAGGISRFITRSAHRLQVCFFKCIVCLRNSTRRPDHVKKFRGRSWADGGRSPSQSTVGSRVEARHDFKRINKEARLFHEFRAGEVVGIPCSRFNKKVLVRYDGFSQTEWVGVKKLREEGSVEEEQKYGVTSPKTRVQRNPFRLSKEHKN